nr:sialidase family protein [uncultured Rhodoferax sp.]
MNRFLSIASILASVGMVLGCAGGGISSKSNYMLAQVDDISTGASQTIPAVMEVNGKPVMLYSNKSGRVVLQNGERQQLMEATARVKQGGSYFQLNKQGQNLQALWWSHQDGKNVYMASSTDSGQTFAAVSMVNDENGVLPPFSLAHAEDGVLGAIYHDERLLNYQAYFNRSTDYGRTWARPDQRLDTPPSGGRSSNAHEPKLVQVGKVWLSAWTEIVQIDGKNAYQIVSRRSEDTGKSWSAPKILYQASHQISSLVARVQDGHIVLAADELNSGVFALTSGDQGRSWTGPGILQGTDGVNNSGIDMVVSDGRVHLVWMRDRTDEKTRIMRGSFDIGQNKWLSAAQRLDPKPYELTRSVSPVILANSTGQLIAAWTDFRDIRSNIYLSTSKDRGQTWASAKPLLVPGEVAAGWPKLIPWQDDVAIAYETYPTDVATNGKFHVRQLPATPDGNTLLGIAETVELSESTRRARLDARVKLLWENRVASTYEPIYDLFDFAYKAATPKKNYLDNVGVITYLAYKVDTVTVEGNIATVNMKLKYEVKPTTNPFTGKQITVPAVDVETPTKWVWVANDWYLVYTPSFEPPVLRY